MSLEGVRSGTLDATGTALEVLALGVLADNVALEVVTTSKGPLALGTALVLVGAIEGAEARVSVAVGAQVEGARESLAALGALVARLGVGVTHLLSGDHARGFLRGDTAATSLLGGLKADLGGRLGHLSGSDTVVGCLHILTEEFGLREGSGTNDILRAEGGQGRRDGF